jgi:hypothetical protein
LDEFFRTKKSQKKYWCIPCYAKNIFELINWLLKCNLYYHIKRFSFCNFDSSVPQGKFSKLNKFISISDWLSAITIVFLYTTHFLLVCGNLHNCLYWGWSCLDRSILYLERNPLFDIINGSFNLTRENGN